MAIQDNVRVFGVPKGAPGVRVVERAGFNAMQDPRYGTTMMFGVLQRGPMGLPIPFNNYAEYQDICGDPRDQTWHLFQDGSQLLPDAIDGYYKTGGGAGQLWLVRLDLDGKARKSSVILKNSLGTDCLKIEAANEGRWGGQANEISYRPIIFATINTFTLSAPGTLSNEFVGGIAEFSNDTGKTYEIVGNTEADPVSGEVVFTLAAQYSLIADNVSGPTTLTGTASYTRYSNLTGTASFELTVDATGTATLRDRVITGVGTTFLTEFEVGHNVYYNGEARVVTSVTSDTTMTVDAPFALDAASVTIERDNVTVTGAVGSKFQTELAVGQTVYAMIGGVRQGRTIASITSETSMKLTSGFTEALTAAQLSQDNLTVTGTTTQFTTELQAGVSYIVDPNRAGNAVRVVTITDATSIEIEKAFSYDFTDAQITKQSLSAKVSLPQVGNAGLSIDVGQGTKYPSTHFSINVRFNGSLVYQAPDVSLDPSDPKGLFVDTYVNSDGKNIAYRTGSMNYQKWITTTNLWTSAYTTHSSADVRPANGSGIVLALTATRLYTVGDFDYAGAMGNLLYPNPYQVARSYFRVTGYQAPVGLQGTISSTGVNVTGTSTNFQAALKAGDYLYDPVNNQARKIRSVVSNTSLVLESAFTTNLPALTKTKKTGYLEVSRGYDLRVATQVGKRFLVQFPQFLSKGYDGDLGGIIPYYYTKYFDVDANIIENAVWGKNLGLVRTMTPGVSDSVVQKAGSFYAEQRAFEYRAEVPSNYYSASTAEVFVNQYLGRNDFQSIAFPSYGYISNPLGNGERFISLSGEIAGGEAARSNVAQGYHVPFAGVDALMARVIKLPIDVKPQDEAVLNLAGIQPIKMMYGNCVVWGGRATSISPLYDFLHIRRIQTNYVRVFLEARELLEQMFKPAQPYTVEQIIMVLNAWARKEYAKGVFTQYLSFQQAVEISGPSVGTGVITDANQSIGLVDIINGKLQIAISYVPTGIIEELSINLGPDILVSQYGNSLSGSLY
jgi:hypothetical protein